MLGIAFVLRFCCILQRRCYRSVYLRRSILAAILLVLGIKILLHILSENHELCGQGCGTMISRNAGIRRGCARAYDTLKCQGRCFKPPIFCFVWSKAAVGNMNPAAMQQRYAPNYQHMTQRSPHTSSTRRGQGKYINHDSSLVFKS